MRVLILIDEITIPFLKDGMAPTAPYSHDKNLFQFAHESLRRGFRVFLTAAQLEATRRPYYEIEQVYPLWKQKGEPVGYVDVAPDIVVSVFPEALNIRHVFPHPKIVAINAAMHWVESPERFPAQYVFDLITATRYNIDFMITQNERMKEILSTMLNFLAKWPYNDRILVSPLGIVDEEVRAVPDREAIRRKMGLKPGEIAIINSGGVWRWTDFNNFFDAFGQFSSSHRSRLKFFVMGVKQPMNYDHEAYTDAFERLVQKYSHLLGDKIFIMNDWDEASRLVKDYTYAADIGLNVNLPSLENWQSYRLRFLDYMNFGMPAINTFGDVMSEACPDALFLAQAGKVESYVDILSTINSKPGLVRTKAEAMKKVARQFDSQLTYGKAIDTIVATPRRLAGDDGAWGESVLDYANTRITADTRANFKNKILSLIQ